MAAGTLFTSREAKAHHGSHPSVEANIVLAHYVAGIGGNQVIQGGSAGVYGEGRIGVEGHSTNAREAGLKGTGYTGVWGITREPDYSGVYGEHQGDVGNGTTGIGKGATGAGILGMNSSGYGGQFEGGRAQLMLKPADTKGKPAGAHTKGEIYMDSTGTLFICVKEGTPGRWKRVNTTAV